MNRRSQEICKVLVAGPVGVGKTTAVQTVSDAPILTTEARPTDQTRLQKPGTTVAMDFGVLRMDDNRTVHLYGTPGQRRFAFMWEILAGGSSGVILLMDASTPAVMEEFELYLDAFAPKAGTTHLAVGITRRQLPGHPGIARFHEQLVQRQLRVPVFDADPRSRHDIVVLLQSLMATIRWSTAHD